MNSRQPMPFPEQADSFNDVLRQLCDEVNTALTSALARDEWPGELAESIRYSVMAGGKRLRPSLVLLACHACGTRYSVAMPAACAVEFIHTYSLIHDDLPAMDDDELRRGKPTNHIVFGEATAILAGDALLTLAFETLSVWNISSEVAAACVLALSRAAGGAGMVGGQILDLAAERSASESDQSAHADEGSASGCIPADSAVHRANPGGKPSTNPSGSPDGSSVHQNSLVDRLTQIHRMKTARLIEASLEMGAIVGRATMDQKNRLTEYGRNIGLAFQIADDLLDKTGDASRTGKHGQRDEQLGKLTFPSLLGVEAARAEANRLVDSAVEVLEPFGAKAEILRQVARFIVERDH